MIIYKILWDVIKHFKFTSWHFKQKQKMVKIWNFKLYSPMIKNLVVVVWCNLAVNQPRNSINTFFHLVTKLATILSKRALELSSSVFYNMLSHFLMCTHKFLPEFLNHLMNCWHCFRGKKPVLEEAAPKLVYIRRTLSMT